MEYGIEEDEAYEKAIRDMGDASVIGIQMNETHHLRIAKHAADRILIDFPLLLLLPKQLSSLFCKTIVLPLPSCLGLALIADEQIAYKPIHAAVNEELRAHVEDKAEISSSFRII